MSECALVVVSDLHISAGELDDFDPELDGHFEAFLDELRSLGSPCELVINGDFLDFVQAPEWSGRSLESSTATANLCFTEAQSIRKLAAITSAHPRIWNALNAFLKSSPGHRLVILPGNHDADLFWPGVQEALRQAICQGAPQLDEQLVLHLARVYRPQGCPGAWIEHGHQFDVLNRFFVGEEERWSEDRPPYLRDGNGQERLLECDGTLFLIRFLNRLDRDYPLVDNVKPFGLFLKLFAASAFDGVSESLQVCLAMTRLLSVVARGSVTNPRSLLTVSDVGDGDDLALSTVLAGRLAKLAASTTELDTRLARAGFAHGGKPLALLLDDKREAPRVMEFLAEHSELLDGLEPDAHEGSGLLDLDGSEGTLSLAKGFWTNESAVLVTGARQVLATPHVECVLMGHTHEALVRPDGISYLNTGCWTRYYDHNLPAQRASWSALRKASYSSFPYRLRYALVKAGQPASSVTLENFRERLS